MIFIKVLKNAIQIKKYVNRIIDMIANKLSNEKRDSIVTELFIRRRKLNISFVFITQCCFANPINIRLNSAHYFVMKIPNKRELQQIALNLPSDIDFEDFMNLYKSCTAKQSSFILLLYQTILYDFRKNISERI